MSTEEGEALLKETCTKETATEIKITFKDRKDQKFLTYVCNTMLGFLLVSLVLLILLIYVNQSGTFYVEFANFS